MVGSLNRNTDFVRIFAGFLKFYTHKGNCFLKFLVRLNCKVFSDKTLVFAEVLRHKKYKTGKTSGILMPLFKC